MNDFMSKMEEMAQPVIEKLAAFGWEIKGYVGDYGPIGEEYTIDFKSPRMKEWGGIIPWMHVEVETQILKREQELYIKQLLAACDKVYFAARASFETNVRFMVENDHDFMKETSFEFTVDLS